MNSLAAGKVISGNTKLSIFKRTRQYSKTSATTGNGNGAHLARAEDTEMQRDFVVNVLNANATRRDAKQYLARFTLSKRESNTANTIAENERNAQHRKDQDRVDRMGVNLGGLYAPARAIANTPQFTQQGAVREQTTAVPEQHLHIALACLRAPGEIDDVTLDGLAVTLSQLVKLDMTIVLVMAYDDLTDTRETGDPPVDIKPIRNAFAKQASRICDALDRHSPEGGRSVPNSLEQADQSGGLEVAVPELIADPLRRGIIPIVPSMAYSRSGKLLPVSTSEVMIGLTKFLSGLDNASGKQKTAPSPEATSLDRIIVLDVVGGIPSKDRGDGAHVFINLQQEFDQISQELSEYAARKNGGSQQPTIYDRHRANMDLIRRCLTLLPTSSSALIVTPHEAASSSRRSKNPPLGAGTRRQKNPLIHNLLTNKPLISSSLPVARFTNPTSSTSDPSRAQLSTVLRLGMPLTIIPPPPSTAGWQLPLPSGTTSLDLTTDPRVDLPRLIYLIENSFRRRLNVPHYLSRIHSRLAGLIIAGQYEGAAILTWEMPPGVNDPSRLVPYLDKFAVLQSSQGSSGVADIVFQAMVRSGFPQGVCWRSRVGNPVNKWYFERSEGSWRVKGTQWVMFWTGKGVVEDKQRWEDYVAVCRSIPASLEPAKG